MDRMGRSSYARLALVGIVGAGALLTAHPAEGFASSGPDPLAHAFGFALPPPDLCYLCLVLDDPSVELPTPAEPDTLAVDDGHSLPLASRAPPEQA